MTCLNDWYQYISSEFFIMQVPVEGNPMFQVWLVNANLTFALVRWNKNWTYWVQVCDIFGEKWVKISTQNWKVKHEDGSMMFFSTSGVSHLVKVDGITNKGHYIQIWDEKIHLTGRRPQHMSMLAKKGFFGKNANILEWPCQSPDQNPIKNLRGELNTTEVWKSLRFVEIWWWSMKTVTTNKGFQIKILV